ncbi:MAG: transporter permease [Anaerocolumna sp.]|jgi:ABC-2 type transport system permease protein|nr:transporter permease [Anaerocolumna sp.]
MLHIQRIHAIFYKQIKDTLKNTQILVLFFVYPIIASVLTTAMSNQTEGTGFFVGIFSTMHMIFTPIVITAAIISEEKEKNTLRNLIMTGVNPMEYLISIGSFVLFCTILTGSVFIFIGDFKGSFILIFLVSIFIGSFISILLGMAIGANSKNIMGANAIAVPVGILFAFLPMVAAFNTKIESFSNFIYSQQISKIITDESTLSFKSLLIIIINLAIVTALFLFAYRKNSLDE